MDNQMIAWIAVLIVAVVVEIITLGLSSIWFAGGALVALIIAAFHGPFLLQVVSFLVVSLLLLIFTRPIAVKYFNRDRTRTNVESIVGRQAIVLDEVSNLHGTGRVSVGGQEWSARSVDNDVDLQEGSVVEVVAVSGVKLICKSTDKPPVETAETKES